MQITIQELHKALLEETRRRLFAEGVPRLKKCLELLPTEKIWHRPNANSNSVGNLVLHLCGNVKQWILSGLGKAKDTRTRQLEFDEEGPVETQIMLTQLDQIMEDVEIVLQQLEPEDLVKKHLVQGFQENGTAILVHVVEHFSYHVGQITYITKALLDIDVAYYGDIDLDLTDGEN